MHEPVIHIEDLTMAYGDKPVLLDLDLDIPRQTRTAIIGPNGAGKSTLVKGILELEPLVSGHVTFWDHQPLDQVRQRIAYVPQKSQVNWDFPTTVLDVVLMGRYGHLGLFRRPSEEDGAIALQALEEMQMLDYRNRQISQLSGGQRQRVFIARALAQEADLYIMDEPLAGVDETTEKIIIGKFVDLQDQGKTVVAIHHDLYTLPEYFDYLVILNRTVKDAGPMHKVYSPANIDRAYKVRA